jgi:hypothetical protein
MRTYRLFLGANMRTSTVVTAMAAAVALAAAPLRAQTVDAGVVIHSGPVTGHVVIGEPPPLVVYEEPVRQIIVVEHIHVPHGNAHGWWKKHGYRPVTRYYDGDSYYARPYNGGVQLREVVVYEREGQYYDEREQHGHGHGDHGHGHGNHGHGRDDSD